MTSSADRVSSSLQMGDTTDDDKPCGQDVHQLEGILAKLLHSGDADSLTPQAQKTRGGSRNVEGGVLIVADAGP